MFACVLVDQTFAQVVVWWSCNVRTCRVTINIIMISGFSSYFSTVTTIFIETKAAVNDSTLKSSFNSFVIYSLVYSFVFTSSDLIISELVLLCRAEY